MGGEDVTLLSQNLILSILCKQQYREFSNQQIRKFPISLSPSSVLCILTATCSNFITAPTSTLIILFSHYFSGAGGIGFPKGATIILGSSLLSVFQNPVLSYVVYVLISSICIPNTPSNARTLK